MIQVGFNEHVLQQRMLLEEIHLLLDGNLPLAEPEICTTPAPIFAPFPEIILIPGETFYLPVDPPSQGISKCFPELQNSYGTSGTAAQGPGASGDPGKDSEDQKKESTKDDSRSHRKTPNGTPNPGDSSSDDEEDDKGKKKSYSGRKGKGRQRRPRAINIPFESTLLTTGPNGNCKFTTKARIDITVRGFIFIFFKRALEAYYFMITQVNEDQASRPPDSPWHGPSFTVETAELDLTSTQVTQLAYFLSFVQTKIKATSKENW